MYIRYILYIKIILLFTVNNLLSQPFVDTIYSGRSTSIDFSESISYDYANSVSNIKFHNSRRANELKIKSIVPFILMRNTKKRVKSELLLKYDTIIYTIFTKRGLAIHETIFMEMFFENESLAKDCINGLKKLEKAFDIYKYSDVVESKTEMVGQLEHYNCYFTRKGNIVYFIYNMIPDSKEYPIAAIMKEKLLEIID